MEPEPSSWPIFLSPTVTKMIEIVYASVDIISNKSEVKGARGQRVNKNNGK